MPDWHGMRLVVVESPWAGRSPEDAAENEAYARACLTDCLRRGEAPFASHLLYTQPGVLDDGNPAERRIGMAAGFAWRTVAVATVVYTDRGVSPGMEQGIAHAREIGCAVEMRKLNGGAR